MSQDEQVLKNLRGFGLSDELIERLALDMELARRVVALIMHAARFPDLVVHSRFGYRCEIAQEFD
jgi:hypothetical protein